MACIERIVRNKRDPIHSGRDAGRPNKNKRGRPRVWRESDMLIVL